MPDDCVNLDGSPNAGDGPFCKAFQAHPAIYPRGGKAKVCVSQQGASTGGANKIYPWTEFVDQEDSVVIGR
jgi:hypothetical protein